MWYAAFIRRSGAIVQIPRKLLKTCIFSCILVSEKKKWRICGMTQSETGQKNNYYKKYSDTDVTFTKQVIYETGLVPHRIILNFCNENIRCLLYSTSMKEARVIAKMSPTLLELLELGNKEATLHLDFRLPKQREAASIAICTEILFHTYYQSGDLYFMLLHFAQTPPEDLILILGRFLEKETRKEQRQEKRISITSENTELLNLESDKIIIVSGGKKQECFLRDISLSGAKIIVEGTGEMFLNKKVMLIMNIKGIEGIGEIIGKVINCEKLEVEEPCPFISLGLKFETEGLPPSYKQWLQTCISKTA
jgi:hypothetical protein